MNAQIIILTVVLLCVIIAIIYYIKKEPFTNFYDKLPLNILNKQNDTKNIASRENITGTGQNTITENTTSITKINLPPNTLFQFETYINMINAIFNRISSNNAINVYNFIEIPPPPMEQHEKYKKDILMILTEKLNENTNEELIIQEPNMTYNKDINSNAILIKYYFTLSNPRRSSYINSLANILIVDKIDIINVHTTNIKMDLTNNGYENIQKDYFQKINNNINIDINDCYPPGLISP